MNPRYQPAPHHRLLAGYLELVEAGKLQRLIIEIPPRHGKSELCTIRFPAWYIGRGPDRRVLITSYGAQLAHRFGGAVRNQLTDYRWPFLMVNLAQNSKARHQWDIESHHGGMLTAGVAGAITGQGGELIIIDDPVKSRDQADSETFRETTWEWYSDTLYTRLEPRTDGRPGAIIVIMTRWHEDDLAGRLQARMRAGDGDRWTVLRLPAVAEEHDILGREPGDALWPERYPVRALDRIRTSLGERGWTALYQQRPSAAEGMILKRQWWRYWSYNGEIPGTMPLPRMDAELQSWDMAFKDGDKNDFVCGQVWGQSGADAFLVDQVHAKLDFVATKDAVRNLSKRHPKALLKLVEDKANGTAIINELSREMPGIVAVNPEGSKFARAASVAPYVESGNVYLPHPDLCPWTNGFVDECAAFPRGAHDDQVDALSQAITRMAYGVDAIGDTVIAGEDRVLISRY